MVDVTALPNATTPTGTELMVLYQGSGAVKYPLGNLPYADANGVIRFSASMLPLDGSYLGGQASFYSGSWRNAVAAQGGWAIQNSAGDFTILTGTSPGAAGTAFSSFTVKFIVTTAGNIGLSVVPANWSSAGNLTLPSTGSIAFNGTEGYVLSNLYFNAGWKNRGTGGGAVYYQNAGIHLWYRTASGAADAAASFLENMRIDASGNLLVGYTTSNGSYKLQVNSQIFATSSTIATSDARYKKNIKPLTGMLDLVMKLRPVQFDWKAHPIHEFDRSNKTVGFIAQEVQEALADTPFAGSVVKSNTCTLKPAKVDVETGKVLQPAVEEEFLGIAEGNLVALLTAALQEANRRIDALEAKLCSLES